MKGNASVSAGVRPSMGSVGDAYDAMCESFFATLECELLDRNRFRTQAEARMAVFQFIEGWYNPHRLHSGLGYFSPINFECRARTTTHMQSTTETEQSDETTLTGRGGLAQRLAPLALPLEEDQDQHQEEKEKRQELNPSPLTVTELG